MRAFSAHQISVALLGLASIRSPRLQRPAATAAVATDMADIASAVAEARFRKNALAPDLVSGVVFSAAGAATAAATFVPRPRR